MFLAAESGYADIVCGLLDAGAIVDPVSQEGGTPLMAAALAGHLDVVEKLVERGADVTKTMWDGAGALFLAAQGGHARILRYFLEIRGIKVKQKKVTILC